MYLHESTAEQKTTTPVPRWYWAIGVIALIWNLMGCDVLLMELFYQEEMMVDFTDEQKEWSRSFGASVYVLWGISVFAGIAGCINLLRRKKVARVFLDLSFVSIFIQMGYTMVIAGGLKVMGPTGAIMPLIIVLIAVGLIWFVRFAGRSEWLRD
ncbi:MAG: hypothetical protein NZ807_04750 [Dehalococcoidia bacterium]|nr:hypothetical protein [Dehalococcoidia bacterium]